MKSQKGFSTVEVLLIIIAVSIIGFIGYYVWHTQQSTSKTLSSSSTASNTSQQAKTSNTTPSAASTTKYVVIKEWGVKAPYTGTQTLSYTIDNSTKSAGFTSAQLIALDPACDGPYGGSIQRLAPNDDASEDGTAGLTASSYAASLDKSTYAYINGYYYFFRHAQSACPSASHPSSNETDQLSNLNQEIQALVPKLQSSN